MKVFKSQVSKYVFLLLFVGVAPMFAQSIELTDKSGTIKIISDPKIYYTNKNGGNLQLFHTPDVESNGVRTKMCSGRLLLEWTKMSNIDFLQEENQIEVTSKKGKKDKFTYTTPSSDGLHGNMELGEYSIDFKEIKNIRIINEKSAKGSK